MNAKEFSELVLELLANLEEHPEPRYNFTRMEARDRNGLPFITIGLGSGDEYTLEVRQTIFATPPTIEEELLDISRVTSLLVRKGGLIDEQDRAYIRSTLGSLRTIAGRVQG